MTASSLPAILPFVLVSLIACTPATKGAKYELVNDTVYFNNESLWAGHERWAVASTRVGLGFRNSYESIDGYDHLSSWLIDSQSENGPWHIIFQLVPHGQVPADSKACGSRLVVIDNAGNVLRYSIIDDGWPDCSWPELGDTLTPSEPMFSRQL